MEKNITALQHVRSKSKQRVTLQNIFRFINKGALSIDSEQSKRAKNASFFINPIDLDSNKNDGPDNVERVHKYPESLEAIEKLESFADHDLGNNQNVTPSMDLINTPLLYRKDRSSHPEAFLRKGVLKICSQFTGEHPF